MKVSWQSPHAPSRTLLNLFAPILITHQPIHASKRQSRGGERQKLFGGGCRHIHNHQLTYDREQSNKNNCTNLHDRRSRSAITRRDRLNSRAMITVKIIPNTAWNTE